MPIVKKEDWKYSDLKGMANHVYDLFVRQMKPASMNASRSGCVYAGPSGECALGCLWPREVAEAVEAHGGGSLYTLLHREVIEIPDAVTEPELRPLQSWHDRVVKAVDSQRHRHNNFPHLSLIDNPLTFGSAEN
jgi:hypothetical protein